MGAVRTEKLVAGCQRSGCTRRYGFLPYTRVHGSPDTIIILKCQDGFLKIGKQWIFGKYPEQKCSRIEPGTPAALENKRSILAFTILRRFPLISCIQLV